MTTIKAHYDGKTIIPDQAVSLPIGQSLTLHVEIQKQALPSVAAQLAALEQLLEISSSDDTASARIGPAKHLSDF